MELLSVSYGASKFYSWGYVDLKVDSISNVNTLKAIGNLNIWIKYSKHFVSRGNANTWKVPAPVSIGNAKTWKVPAP